MRTITDLTEKTANDNPDFEERNLRPRKKVPPLDYEWTMWVVFGTIVVLVVADRFTTNVWPRETHRIGSGTAGSDFVGGLKPGPWSAQAYDAIARISGRYTIVALNLLMFTMMHTTFDWLSESWIGRNVIDFANMEQANYRLHKWNGIGIVVMTLVHVWSIFFPCMFHGWKADVILGKFEWILSERGPKGFKDIDLANKTMNLQGDDVFRLVEMTLLLAVLLPLSVRWLSTRWHLGIHVHSLINVLYFIDIVRRHTHPHSWFLNTPFFFGWIADLIVGVYWRRQNPRIFRKYLSSSYLVLFFQHHRKTETIGPSYSLRLKDSSKLERAHKFTAFENRLGIDLADGNDWSTGIVVRVYDKKRRPRIGRKEYISHTYRIAQATELDMFTWGPFHGYMSEQVKRSLQQERAVTLVAGGSAVAFLLDALQEGKSRAAPLTLLHTCRDVALFEWVVKTMRNINSRCQFANISILMALTSGQDTDNSFNELKVKEMEDFLLPDNESSSKESFGSNAENLRVHFGRINFMKTIGSNETVFFQGSGGLLNAVRKACKANESKLIAGPSYDEDKSANSNLLHRLKFTGHDHDAV